MTSSMYHQHDISVSRAVFRFLLMIPHHLFWRYFISAYCWVVLHTSITYLFLGLLASINCTASAWEFSWLLEHELETFTLPFPVTTFILAPFGTVTSWMIDY